VSAHLIFRSTHPPSAPKETNSETVIKSTEIELGPEIARGGYGTVFKGKCRYVPSLAHGPVAAGRIVYACSEEIEA
jgi:hypothetical protein